MTSPRRFEQDLPVLLETLYLAGTPDYRDDLVRQIAATRQRPAWTFPERWLPVDITTQRVATPRMPWRAIGVLALIGILIAATIAAYIGSRPRFPAPYGVAQNGSIVYAVDGDVFIRDTVDGTATPLISGPQTEIWAVYSPLGDQLAILREADGAEELWVAAADGTDLRRIGGPYRAGDWLEWSPDARHIAVSYNRGGTNAIEIIPVDGSGARPVAAGMPAMFPTWRPPDGRQLLFRGQEDGRWGFYLVDIDGGEPVRLPIDGDGVDGGAYDLLGPAWSPTGDRLAYHSLVNLPQSDNRTPGFRVFVADIAADGTITGSDRLGSDPTVDDELGAVFTPDGGSLVYQRRMSPTDDSADPDSVDSLLIMPADGQGEPRELGVDSSPAQGFSWAIAPDGRSVMVHRFAETDDWLVDLASSTAVKTDLVSSTGVSWQRTAP
jgi:Tol biopolymer transport system component